LLLRIPESTDPEDNGSRRLRFMRERTRTMGDPEDVDIGDATPQGSVNRRLPSAPPRPSLDGEWARIVETVIACMSEDGSYSGMLGEKGPIKVSLQETSVHAQPCGLHLCLENEALMARELRVTEEPRYSCQLTRSRTQDWERFVDGALVWANKLLRANMPDDSDRALMANELQGENKTGKSRKFPKPRATDWERFVDVMLACLEEFEGQMIGSMHDMPSVTL